MKIKICYFAKIREQLDLSEEQLVLPDACDNTESLREFLQARGERWSQVFSDTQVVLNAVNHEIVSENYTLNDGDEVAFFPPVTGG